MKKTLFLFSLLFTLNSEAIIPFALWRDTCELNSKWTPQWASVVGYWNLNGVVGASIANNEAIPAAIGAAGTAKNAGSSYAAGKVKSVVSFGSTTYITMGNPASLNGSGLSEGTVMAWVKHNGGGTQTLVGKEMSYKLQIQDIGSGLAANFYASSDGTGWTCNAPATSTVAANTWVHVAATWHQTNNFQVYYNGVSQPLQYNCSMGSSGPPKNTVYNFQISGYDTTNEIYTGLLDEVVVFNKALTAAEILAIYNKQVNCNY